MQTNEPLVPGRNCLLYVPFTKQLEFLAGRGIYDERACLCGGGAGKTITGLFEAIRWALDFPGSVGILTEPTYPMVRLNLFEALESKWLLGCAFPFNRHPYVAAFTQKDMCLHWKNGSKWFFRSWDHPENLEGANVDYIYIDEPRLILHLDTALLTAKRRLRGSNRCKGPVRPGLWLTTTTDKIGSTLFKELEDPKTKNPESKIYRWSTLDNPFLPKQFVDAMLQAHTGGLAERFIYGRFANIGTGSFSFDSSIHVPESAGVNIPEFDSLNVRYGVDFGWTNPSAIVVDGFDGDDRLWVLDEFYKNHSSAETLIDVLVNEFFPKYGEGPVYCDKSEPESIEKFKAAGVDANPYTYKREDGIRDLGSRFEKAGDGRPRIYVSARCINAISELLEYQIEVKERDHAVDAIRYGIPLESSAPLDAFRFG